MIMAVNWTRVEFILMLLGFIAAILIILGHYFEAQIMSEEK